MTSDGVVAVVADQSRPDDSDQWARAAVALAVDVGASEIAVESFAARETYLRVASEALARSKTPHPIRVTAWPPKGSGRGGGDAVAGIRGAAAGPRGGYLPDRRPSTGSRGGRYSVECRSALPGCAGRAGRCS